MNVDQITEQTVICRSDALLSNNLGDDVVMMDIEQGAYYGMEGVAARIWKLTEEPVSVGELCNRLTTEYEISPEKCQQEVTGFLGDLVNRNIVEIVS
jgi:hypothetical protein